MVSWLTCLSALVLPASAAAAICGVMPISSAAARFVNCDLLLSMRASPYRKILKSRNNIYVPELNQARLGAATEIAIGFDQQLIERFGRPNLAPDDTRAVALQPE